MSGTATNVTAGKPKTSGSLFAAPAGTTAPTDASTALAAAFKELGFVSEDGVVEGLSISTTNIKEWGGAVVLITQDEKTATLKFKLIEYLNADVQKFANGVSNVTGALETGLKVTVNDSETDEHVLVVDQVLRGGVALRMVYPRCKITSIGDITYKTNEAVAYDLTVTAIKDENGDYYHKYFYRGATGATGATGETSATSG